MLRKIFFVLALLISPLCYAEEIEPAFEIDFSSVLKDVAKELASTITFSEGIIFAVFVVMLGYKVVVGEITLDDLGTGRKKVSKKDISLVNVQKSVWLEISGYDTSDFKYADVRRQYSDFLEQRRRMDFETRNVIF
ncbi:MAG: hypothetical protein Q4C70_04990 [Planctomycetia bacterium]|nr:hypothetical protein [Planctomycetia bacterium]